MVIRDILREVHLRIDVVIDDTLVNYGTSFQAVVKASDSMIKQGSNSGERMPLLRNVCMYTIIPLAAFVFPAGKVDCTVSKTFRLQPQIADPLIGEA
jgi:hypothetical protein